MLIKILLSLLMSADAHAATCSRVLSFQDGSILTASQLNSEFNSINNCANSIDNSNISSGANIAASKISTSIDGSGISRDGTTGALSVGVDNTTIEISSDLLRVKDESITSAKIANGAVAGEDIANTTIPGTKMQNLTITAAQLAEDSVTTIKILDGNVTGGKIANTTIPGTKLQAETITATQLAEDSVGTSELGASAVETTNINNLAVTTGKIADGAIGSLKIADGTVEGVDMANTTIPGTKLQVETITATQIAAEAITTPKLGIEAVTYGNQAGGNDSTTTTSPGATNSTAFVDIGSSSITLIKPTSAVRPVLFTVYGGRYGALHVAGGSSITCALCISTSGGTCVAEFDWISVASGTLTLSDSHAIAFTAILGNESAAGLTATTTYKLQLKSPDGSGQCQTGATHFTARIL